MDLIEKIKALDRKKILRPNYGDTSLKSWEPIFDEMLTKLDLIDKYWNNVSAQVSNATKSHLHLILSHLTSLTNFSETQFVTDKQNMIIQINQSYSEIKFYWPHFAIAALEESGILKNNNVKQEFEAMTKKMQTATESALAKIDKESKEIISQAKAKAEEIENSVRKTAQKISVKEAQDQFCQAAKDNSKNILIWSFISLLCIISFIILIIIFITKKIPGEWTWQIIYYSVIRATTLGFIATMIAFCLGILKAHLHMKEHNLHRQRISNSMASFAESAANKDQRDLILSRLIESVSTFGNSGMIGNDHDGNAKIIIDDITKTLSAIKGKN